MLSGFANGSESGYCARNFTCSCWRARGGKCRIAGARGDGVNGDTAPMTLDAFAVSELGADEREEEYPGPFRPWVSLGGAASQFKESQIAGH